MTLTEEQRDAVAFDLEKARAADEALPYPLDANEIWVSGKGQMHINPPNAPSIFFTLSDLCEFRSLFHGQAAEIERLRACLEQSERVIEAGLDVIKAQAIQIKALEDVLAEYQRLGKIISESVIPCPTVHGNCSHAAVLRAMVDSSGTVEPTGGFDLERARGLRDFLQDDCAEVGDVWAEMVAEIERLRAENLELQVAVFGPDGIRAHQACIIADQAARISELEIEIAELKADLEQSERVIEARLDVIDQQAKEIKEREASLDEAETLTKKNAELMNAYLARIAELEDALAEERAGAIRCEFNDHCEIDLPDAMIRARQELQAEGKIGSGGGA